MTNTICYKMKEKFYGEDTFLVYYSYKDIAEIQAEVDRLNTEKPAALKNGKLIDWNKVDYFFVSAQEEM